MQVSRGRWHAGAATLHGLTAGKQVRSARCVSCLRSDQRISLTVEAGKKWHKAQQYEKRELPWVRLILPAISIAVTAVIIAMSSPALASGSTIDIGVTRQSGSNVYGGGSYYNNGDYTNVCLVIMAQDYNAPWTGSRNQSQECHQSTGSYWFPTLSAGAPSGGCYAFWTRVTAYNNGARVSNKDSNTIFVGSGC